MTPAAPGHSAAADPYVPDSPYAYVRLGLSILIATIVGAGMWAVIVVMPAVQAEFGADRAAASLPYTLMMLGLAGGSVFLGRLMDRAGISVLLALSSVCLCAGFVIAGFAPNLMVFTAAHAMLLGIGAGSGFGPMMADISHW